jgi:hypothetical protein
LLFSPLPGGAVEVGVWLLRLDAVHEPPGRGSIRDVGTGQATFRPPEWRRPTMRPRTSKIKERESPLAENEPAFWS